MASVGNAHDVQFQPVLLHQLLPLHAYLLNQASAHRAHAADEEIEFLVFGEEERVVYDIERLAQRFFFDHKRDVGLRSTLRAGNHVDAILAHRAEQFAGDARRMLHVLAHDSHRSQVGLGDHAADFTHFDFLGKFLVEHFAGQRRAGLPHTD